MKKWFTIIILSTLACCGRTEPEEEASETIDPQEKAQLPAKIYSYSNSQGDTLTVLDARTFSLDIKLAKKAPEQPVSILNFTYKGNYQQKLNGFTRFEISEDTTVEKEGSPISVGSTFYGRLSPEESILALHPADGSLQIWLSTQTCPNAPGAAFEARSPRIQSAVQNQDLLQIATGWNLSFSGDTLGLESPLSYAYADEEVPSLETPRSYSCVQADANPMNFYGTTYISDPVIGKYQGYDPDSLTLDHYGFFLMDQTNQLPNSLESELYAVGVSMEKTHYFKLEASAQSETGFTLDLKDIRPSDSVEGNYLKETFNLVKNEAGYFETEGSTSIRCFISVSQTSRRSQWVMCQGLLENSLPIQDQDLFFLATSPQRKLTKEEKKSRQDAETKELEELEKKLKEEAENAE